MHVATDYREILADSAWKHPSDYGGFSPDGDYLIVSRHRESDLISESNYRAAYKLLEACPYDGGGWYSEDEDDYDRRPPAYDFRATHPLVGWVEYLLVRHDAPEEVLIKAAEIVASLEDYPLLDEDDYSQREFDEVCERWEGMSLGDRITTCARFGVSIFAARRDSLPEDRNGQMYDWLRTP